jgi:hypothetical protein
MIVLVKDVSIIKIEGAKDSMVSSSITCKDKLRSSGLSAGSINGSEGS